MKDEERNRKMNAVLFCCLFSAAAAADDESFLEFALYEALAFLFIEEQRLTAPITLLAL